MSRAKRKLLKRLEKNEKPTDVRADRNSHITFNAPLVGKEKRAFDHKTKMINQKPKVKKCSSDRLLELKEKGIKPSMSSYTVDRMSPIAKAQQARKKAYDETLTAQTTDQDGEVYKYRPVVVPKNATVQNYINKKKVS